MCFMVMVDYITDIQLKGELRIPVCTQYLPH